MPTLSPRILRLLRYAAIPGLFVVLLLAPGLLGLRSLSTSDQLYLQEPWSNQSDIPDEITGGLTWDTYDQFQPRWIEQRERLLEGDLPLMGDTYPGAEPLSSLPITGMLDPLHLPWIVLPPWLAGAYTKALQLLVAIGFTAAWCRRLGLSRRAGLVGGLAYASSGFITYWSVWPQSNTAAVIPVVFFAVEGVVQRSSARRVAALAGAVGWLFATGFPSVALYTLMVAAPYALVRWWSARAPGSDGNSARRWWRRRASWRPLVAASVGVVLGGALLFVQLVPLRDLVAWNLERRAGKVSATVPLRSLLSTLFPHLEGIPNWHEGPGVEPTTGQYFVGISAAVLIAFALTRRTWRLPPRVLGLFLTVSGLIGAVVFLGGPFLYAIELLPFMKQNAVERMLSVASLLLAVMAAAGAEAWWLRDAPRWSLSGALARRLPMLGAGAVLAIGVVFSVRRWSVLPASASLTLMTIALVAAAGLLLVGRSRRGHSTLTRFGVPVLIAVEGLLFVLPNLGFIDPDDTYPPSTAVSAAVALQGHDRVGEDRVMHPGVGPVYGLRTVSGHAFITGEWYDLLRQVQDDSTISLTFSRLAFYADEGEHPVLDRLAVQYLMRPLGYLPGETEPVQFTAAVDGSRVTLSATVAGPFRGFMVGPPGGVPAGASFRVMVDGVDTTGRRLEFDAGNAAFAAAVAGEDRRPGDRTEIEVVISMDGPAPSAFSSEPFATAVVRPIDDGQRLVHTSDGAIWQRLGALSRYRWADDTEVIADVDEQLAWLSEPQPAGTVLLAEPPSVQPSGGGEVVSIDDGEPEDRTIRTDSTGPGLLIIADAFRNGWTATVDGVETPVLRADHALMAVEVPAGAHTVRVQYTPPGWPVAWWVSLWALLVVATMATWPWLAPRLRGAMHRRRDGEPV